MSVQSYKANSSFESRLSVYVQTILIVQVVYNNSLSQKNKFKIISLSYF